MGEGVEVEKNNQSNYKIMFTYCLNKMPVWNI